MGKNTEISWTNHTWNPWWGCTKVGHSPACESCYAETFAKRVGYSETGSQFAIWGDQTKRRFFGDKHWNEPLKWNASARRSGQVQSVFCASMADWAEGRADQRESLERLWIVQQKTESLIWLMLTKRPQLIRALCPEDGNPRRWHGTTAENQHWLNIRWAHLERVQSPVYWLSMEPLYEAVTLPPSFLALGRRAWVIVGGESGHKAKPMNPDWVRSLRDQCEAAGVSFHFKQWGEWLPPLQDGARTVEPQRLNCSDVPIRCGTKAAGNYLDGRQWKESPVEEKKCPGSAGRTDDASGL